MIFTLAENNGGNGYAIEANPFLTEGSEVSGASPFITLNPWLYVYSVGNVSYGLTISGYYNSTQPNSIVYGIGDLSLANCYFVDDQAGEMFINTLGGHAKIENSFIGLGGTASNSGHCIYLYKNLEVLITGCIIDHNMGSGIFIDNTDLLFCIVSPTTPPTGTVSNIVGEVAITGCKIYNNNQNSINGGSGTYGGINIVANTYTTIVGCKVGNQYSTTQTYSIDTYDASTTVITGCNLYQTNPLGAQAVALNLRANASYLRASSNLGLVTTSSGLSSAILPGNSAPFNQIARVTHNLTGTPKAVSIVPDQVNLTGFATWVQNLTATTFDIYLSQALTTGSGPQSVQFYWTATLNSVN